MFTEYLLSLMIYMAALLGGMQLLLTQWELLRCTWQTHQKAQISIRQEQNWDLDFVKVRGSCSQSVQWQTLEGWDSS